MTAPPGPALTWPPPQPQGDDQPAAALLAARLRGASLFLAAYAREIPGDTYRHTINIYIENAADIARLDDVVAVADQDGLPWRTYTARFGDGPTHHYLEILLYDRQDRRPSVNITFGWDHATYPHTYTRPEKEARRAD